jgi:hypothetical protein
MAEWFRSWDWLFRFRDARCNTATQSECVAVFGAGSRRAERSGLSMHIATTESVLVVRADEILSAFLELEAAIRFQN